MSSQQRIHQMQVAFSLEEDRLQLRINTDAKMEFRFWLTRRFVKRFWPGLRQALEVNASSTMPTTVATPANRTAMLNFMHQHAVSQTDFSSPFQDTSNETPLGPRPILVTRARLEPRPQGGYMVSLHPQDSYGIEVAMDAKLLHSFCQLLTDATQKADWDLPLLLASVDESISDRIGTYSPAGSGYKLN